MVSKCLTKYVIRDRAEMASGTETNTETEAQTAKATSAEASQVCCGLTLAYTGRKWVFYNKTFTL